jgi:SurA N-terminal domain/PPIC-type PPIASE domain
VSNRLRVSSLAILAFAVLPVLSACSTSPGSAAVVGSQKITTGQLQSQVNQALTGGGLQSQKGFNRTTFTRELLGHMISVDVLNAAASSHHVTVSSQDVTAQTATFVKQAGSLAALKQQAAQGGVSAAQLPGFIRFDALQQKLGTALTANLTATPAQLATEYQKDIDTFDQVDIAQIQVKSKALAQHILTTVRANPASFASLAAKDSLDTATKAKGGAVGFVGTSQVQKVLGANSAPLKSGTFQVAHASGSYVVIHVIKRQVQPITAVTSQLKQSLFTAQAQTLLQKAITAEATKLGVHVSPRYGKWDNATQAVVAAPDATSSTASTPAPASPTPTG